MVTKTCAKCGRMIRKRNDLGINMKLLGRGTRVYFCLPHLAEYLDTDVDTLNYSIEAYKHQGCPLFE